MTAFCPKRPLVNFTLTPIVMPEVNSLVTRVFQGVKCYFFMFLFVKGRLLSSFGVRKLIQFGELIIGIDS